MLSPGVGVVSTVSVGISAPTYEIHTEPSTGADQFQSTLAFSFHGAGIASVSRGAPVCRMNARDDGVENHCRSSCALKEVLET